MNKDTISKLAATSMKDLKRVDSKKKDLAKSLLLRHGYKGRLTQKKVDLFLEKKGLNMPSQTIVSEDGTECRITVYIGKFFDLSLKKIGKESDKDFSERFDEERDRMVCSFLSTTKEDAKKILKDNEWTVCVEVVEENKERITIGEYARHVVRLGDYKSNITNIIK